MRVHDPAPEPPWRPTTRSTGRSPSCSKRTTPARGSSASPRETDTFTPALESGVHHICSNPTADKVSRSTSRFDRPTPRAAIAAAPITVRSAGGSPVAAAPAVESRSADRDPAWPGRIRDLSTGDMSRTDVASRTRSAATRRCRGHRCSLTHRHCSSLDPSRLACSPRISLACRPASSTGARRAIPTASAAPSPAHSSTIAHSSGQTSAAGLPGR